MLLRVHDWRLLRAPVLRRRQAARRRQRPARRLARTSAGARQRRRCDDERRARRRLARGRAAGARLDRFVLALHAASARTGCAGEVDRTRAVGDRRRNPTRAGVFLAGQPVRGASVWTGTIGARPEHGVAGLGRSGCRRRDRGLRGRDTRGAGCRGAALRGLRSRSASGVRDDSSGRGGACRARVAVRAMGDGCGR